MSEKKTFFNNKVEFFQQLFISCLLLGFLTACSNGKALESLLQPDPKLKETPQINATISPSPNNLPPAKPTKTPDYFPANIPIYSPATLISVEPFSNENKGKLIWETRDNTKEIANFYEQQLNNNDWQIIQPFTENTNEGLIANRDNLQVTVSAITPVGGATELTIIYENKSATSLTPSPSPSPLQTYSSYNDLTQTTETYQRYIQDLASLGVLTSDTANFKPNEIIKRRDYARWLVQANNRFFVNLPGKQIRLAANTSTGAFADVAKTDADFSYIQGLAEAGIIPSSLSGDSSAVLFKPNAPVTREDLILWKVPLDTRKGLPNASIENVKETWGFQDGAKIEAKALKAVYQDFQSGEQANIRRVFGYTTIFSPKKPVTRAEAAAALWYFGWQNEGISAVDALQINTNTQKP